MSYAMSILCIKGEINNLIINLSPQVRDDSLNVSKQGKKLIINGVEFDFSPLTEGSTLPAVAVECDFLVGDISMTDGDIELTLLLPISANASEAARFPAPLNVVSDGEVVLPC